MKLKRSENLIDDSFVFISRNDNNSNFVDSSFDVVEKYSNCFYRNENSAFDLCDHEIVSVLPAGHLPELILFIYLLIL